MTNAEDSDLSAATGFIIRGITEEALGSNQPLDQDEQFLLANLPRSSALSEWADAEDPLANPRDRSFERLCTLAKAARTHDISTRPDAASDWEFATAVLKLHGHPMLWLLQWAGIEQKKPWWDRRLLFLTATILVGVGLIGMAVADNGNLWARAWWAVLLCGCVLLLLVLPLLSQRMEHSRLRSVIERCRPLSLLRLP